jgi:hypothetical protein
MEYNKHLDIENLRQEGYTDELTSDFASAVYIFRKFLSMYDASTGEDVVAKAIQEFPETEDSHITSLKMSTLYFMSENLLTDIYDDENLRPIIDACEKAITEIYGEKIFADARKQADDTAELLKEANAGEDNDEVYDTDDEDLKEWIEETLIPGLAFVNMALYITYDNQYDLLKLKDYDNNEFWYNEYIDTFINHFNYIDFFLIL